MRTFAILTAVLIGTALLPAQMARRAPGFSLPDSKMELHDLADFRGKPVILEFMQTTCPHCEVMAGILERIRQKYGDRVGILAVANPPDNQSRVGQFIANNKIGYPILFDCGQAAYSYLLTQSFALPQIFVIDQQGMIRSHYGYAPDTKEIFEGNGLAAEIERMLPGGGRKK